MKLHAGAERLGDGLTFSDVGESGLLAAISPVFASTDAIVGPGDDAAVLRRPDGDVVVTTDSMLLGLDWRDEWSSAHDVGVKVIAQNLADVVAMGARPCGVVVAIAAEAQTQQSWLVELTEGLADELRRAGVGTDGGDLSGAPDGVVIITVTAYGVLEPGATPLLRSAAKVGQKVVVSDVLGRSQAGLDALLNREAGDATSAKTRPEPLSASSAATRACVQWHLAPQPRYTAGSEALAAGVRCAMDVSDGLGRDAARLARASGVRIELDPDAIGRMADPLRAVVGDDAVNCVLSSGEEHALLATCDANSIPDGWHVVGDVCDGDGVWLRGREVGACGWQHT